MTAAYPEVARLPNHIAQHVVESLSEFFTAAERYRAGVYTEMELDADRAAAKAAAVRRIMDAQGLAATPAEKLAETDAEYAAHLKRLRDTVRDKNAAWAAMEVARLRARLGIALLTTEQVTS